MNKMNEIHMNRDNGGRRSGIDRREFSYSGYIPERRVIAERRSDSDRRSGLDRRLLMPENPLFTELRSGKERRATFAVYQNGA